MKRIKRLALVFILGIIPGWYSAGFLSSQSFAEPPHAATQPAASATGQPQEEGSHGDPAVNLVPASGSTPWLSPVLQGVVALFGAAIVIGFVNRKLGLRDPGAAATEMDQKAAAHDHAHDHGDHAASHGAGHGADAHGHDAHGHTAGGGGHGH